MLNFRKLRQDFSSNILKEGKELFDALKVVSATLVEIGPKTIKLHGKVQGQYENTYESNIEIDRLECETIDSDCDCPYNYDCQHIAALMLHFEQNYDAILADFARDEAEDKVLLSEDMSEKDKQSLMKTLKEAEKKVVGQKRNQSSKRDLRRISAGSENPCAIAVFF